MTAPLSGLAIEVLRAIALGLELHEIDNGWQFVGPFQEPSRSWVDTATMRSLLDGGLVRFGPTGVGSLTTNGQNALKERSEAALRWVRTSLEDDV